MHRLSPELPGPQLAIAPVRIAYLAMLETLEIPRIREFWQAHPLERDGSILSEADLYSALWGHVGCISALYCEQVWNDFEPFLHRNGVYSQPLVADLVYRLNQSGVWRADQVLSWIKEFLPRLYRDPNPRLTLVKLIGLWGMQAFPGSWGSVPKQSSAGEWTEAVSLWAPSGDFSFRFLYPVELHASPFHITVPVYFGMTPYEHVRLIADCRPPNMVLWDETYEICGEKVFVGGQHLGRVRSFLDWAHEAALDFEGRAVPDRQVIAIERDYVCPKRKRVVLWAGCVYDAPLYLAQFRFRVAPAFGAYANPENYLDRIVAGMLQSYEAEWAPLARTHQQLLELAERRLIFEYRTRAQALLLNDRTLLTGTPARILYKILRGHAEGRRVFDHRSFKYDTELFSAPKATNFELRLTRVQAKLADTTPLARIDRTGDGEFTFNASCRIDLREVEK